MTAKIKLIITGGTMAECNEMWDRIRQAAKGQETAQKAGEPKPANGVIWANYRHLEIEEWNKRCLEAAQIGTLSELRLGVREQMRLLLRGHGAKSSLELLKVLHEKLGYGWHLIWFVLDVHPQHYNAFTAELNKGEIKHQLEDAVKQAFPTQALWFEQPVGKDLAYAESGKASETVAEAGKVPAAPKAQPMPEATAKGAETATKRRIDDGPEGLTAEEIEALREEFGGEEDKTPEEPRQPVGKIKFAELSKKRQALLTEAKTALDGAVPTAIGGLIVALVKQEWSPNKIATLMSRPWGDVKAAMQGRVYPRLALAYEAIKHLFQEV